MELFRGIRAIEYARWSFVPSKRDGYFLDQHCFSDFGTEHKTVSLHLWPIQHTIHKIETQTCNHCKKDPTVDSAISRLLTRVMQPHLVTTMVSQERPAVMIRVDCGPKDRDERGGK